jgi:hypothetical protein
LADESQDAYNACLQSYNTRRNSFGGAWAFVSGVRNHKTYCFWSWREGDYSDSALTSVINSAMNQCRKTGYYKCYQFGHSGVGLVNWSRQISDQGGLSLDSLRRRNRSAANQQALGAFLQGFAGALNSYNSYTRGSSYQGGGSPSRRAGGGSSQTCRIRGSNGCADGIK